jgi:hypothetical protein
MGARKTLSTSGVRVGVGGQVAARAGVATGVAVDVGQGGVRIAAGMVAVVGRLEVFEQPVTLSPKASHKTVDIIQQGVVSLLFALKRYPL